MRILLVAEDLTPGGVARHLTAVVAALQERGHQAELAVRTPHSCDVSISPAPLSLDMLVHAEKTDKRPYDVIFSSAAGGPWRISGYDKIPFVKFWWGDHRPEMFDFTAAHAIVACSERSAEMYRFLVQPPPEFVHLINNPAIAARQRPKGPNSYRQRLAIPDSAFLVCALGRFSTNKRHLRLIYEATPFLEKNRDAYLVIAGPTDGRGAGWNSTFSACEKLRDSLQCAAQVILLGEIMDPAELLQEADVYVSMSASEGQSLATCEAVSLGKPVIVTAVSGTSRQVMNEPLTNGVLLPVTGPTGLSFHLNELHSSPTLRGRLAANASHLAGQFALCRHVDHLEKVLVAATDSEAYRPSIYVPVGRELRVLIITYGSINRVSPRVRAFFMARALAPFQVRVNIRDIASVNPTEVKGYDVVVFHRVVQCLLRIKREKNRNEAIKRLRFIWEYALRIRPTLYDMDDYLFVEESRPLGLHKLNEGLIRSATCVVANSRAAARRFSSLASRVEVIENPVDDLLWNRRLFPRVGRTFTVGWVAGDTHSADWELAANIVRRIVSECGGVRAVILGGTEDSSVRDSGGVTRIPTVRWYDVPCVVSEWDVSLSPLIGSEENHSKGHGHICEPAMFMVPSIVQPTESYSELIDHGVNGLFAGDPMEWVGAVRELFANDALRSRLGDRIYNDVAKRFSFLAIGSAYAKLLRDCAA